MNNVNLIGYIGRDIQSRYTTGDKPMAVARFSVGVNRNKEETDWINCVAFGRTAENIDQYFHKGSQIGITGHIQTGSYKKDGVEHYTTDVVVDRFDFVGKKEDKTEQSFSSQQGFSVMDDDIPF